MSELDEDALIRSCLDGDAGAFERLLERHERTVYNVVLRMVHDRDHARDLTQTAFLKAFEGLETYDCAYPFRGWICRIAVNESLNFLRTSRRVETGHHVEPLGDERTPEEAFADTELGQCVQRALAALSPGQRAVIVLRHFLDCSYRDIAAILGIEEKTVKSRLFTARQVLKDLLADRSPS